MRNLILFILFIGIASSDLFSQASICAIVQHDGKVLQDARIYVQSESGIESFYLTDSLGVALINGLKPGKYTFSIANMENSVSSIFRDVVVDAGLFYLELFKLSDGKGKQYVKKDGDWTHSEPEFTDDSLELYDMVGSAPPAPASAVKRSSEKSKGKDVSYFDIETYEETPMVSEKLGAKVEAPESSFAPEPIGTDKFQNQKAGQLTASEWCDLANWDLWSDQIEEEFLEYSEIWNLKPKYRTSIQLTNKRDEVMVHAFVEMIGQNGDVLASGRTDNKGIAELFSEQMIEGPVKLSIDYMGTSFTVNKKKATSEMSVKLRTACDNSNVVEIMFVVDATGSMVDEINYLKAEVQDVIQRISNLDKDKEVRSGAIFYRDHTDQYLSRRKELSTDVSSLNAFIQEQRADGGGDFPEALDYALDELTSSINWSSEAITKLAFLILDAPPHQDSASVQRIKTSIKRAADQGIRLIPVTGSGIDKSTEYLMKALSISTNGTYLYLTDDSGIGNSHLEASNDKSEVELLNDLMVRVTKEMIEVECFEVNINDDIVLNDWSNNIGYKIFPNPVSDYLNLELTEAVDATRIVDLQGRTLREFGALDQGIHKFEVADLDAGTYFVVFTKDNESYTLKLVCTK